MPPEPKNISHYGNGFIISTAAIDDPESRLVLMFLRRTSTYEFRLCLLPAPHRDEALYIYYTETYLAKFPAFNQLTNLQKDPIICDPEMTSVITRVMDCTLRPEASAPWYEAKALELLTLTLERMSSACTASQKLSAADISMLHTAKDILVSDFENIPTIKQLARKVGTNDYKLKKGFRQLFGSSIFAYVQDVRLENARKLLTETEHSITDIAYMTGYDHCNNFSVAFKRKFGVGAKEVRKKL